MQAQKQNTLYRILRIAQKVSGAKIINPTTVEILYADDQRLTIDFYGENIFRLFQDNNGGVIRDPEAKPEAQILVNNPRKPVSKLTLTDQNGELVISTAQNQHYHQ